MSIKVLSIFELFIFLLCFDVQIFLKYKTSPVSYWMHGIQKPITISVVKIEEVRIYHMSAQS